MKLKSFSISLVFLTLFGASCCKKDQPVPGGCYCPAVYDPVCGSDGKVYGNSCEAACAGVTVVPCDGNAE